MANTPPPSSAPAPRPAPAPVPRRALAVLLLGLTALLPPILTLAARRPWSVDRLPRQALGWRINPQHEDAATLQLLPGVGAALAQRLIDERRRRPLHGLADLVAVPGFGPRTAAKVAPYLTFDPVER